MELTDDRCTNLDGVVTQALQGIIINRINYVVTGSLVGKATESPRERRLVRFVLQSTRSFGQEVFLNFLGKEIPYDCQILTMPNAQISNYLVYSFLTVRKVFRRKSQACLFLDYRHCALAFCSLQAVRLLLSIRLGLGVKWSAPSKFSFRNGRENPKICRGLRTRGVIDQIDIVFYHVKRRRRQQYKGNPSIVDTTR